MVVIMRNIVKIWNYEVNFIIVCLIIGVNIGININIIMINDMIFVIVLLM